MNIGNRRSPKGTKIALTNAAMALASGGGGGGSMAASAVGGKSASAAPVYQLSCDNEVKIVKFRYNFLIHNIFERINGELEKLIKCPAFEIPVSDEAEESPSAAAATGDGVSPPPPHSCTKVKCMFSVDFNATSDNQSMIGAYMHNCTAVPRWFKFSVSVRDVNGALKHTAEVSTKRMEPESGWGLASFVSKHTLTKNRETLCPRGTLNVQFDVCLLVPQTIRADKEPKKAGAAKKNYALSAAVTAENMKADVAKDLSALLYSQSLCDVTLICRPKDGGAGDSSSLSPNERRFTAHKAILGARSPVFLAMFRHADLKESYMNEVVIEDVEADAMQIFLEFVYGRDTSISDFDTACSVLAVADKYDVPGLLRLCESTMVSNVRLANCARAAIAGHLYNASALKETAMAMMMQYGKRLREMEGWDEIKSEHPTLMNEIVEYMLGLVEIA